MPAGMVDYYTQPTRADEMMGAWRDNFTIPLESCRRGGNKQLK